MPMFLWPYGEEEDTQVCAEVTTSTTFKKLLFWAWASALPSFFDLNIIHINH